MASALPAVVAQLPSEPPGVLLRVVRPTAPHSPLAAARVQAGLTVTQLAGAVHVSRPTVSMWERGGRAVARHYWPTLATALAMSEEQVAALFTDRAPSRLDGIRLPGLPPARRAAGVTQRALAQRIGVAPTTLAMWENSTVRVPLGAVEALCSELGLERVALTTDRPQMEPPERPLRRYRRTAGMNRAEAAAHLAISGGALTRYETGQRSTPMAVVRRMARVYGCPVEKILEHSGLTLPQLPPGPWRPDDLPAALTALRMAAGMTKVGLGRAVGRSGSAVAGWEAGRTRPSPSMCRRLEVVWGLTAGRLPR